jgi:putative peptidoglycan lipid II flippase
MNEDSTSTLLRSVKHFFSGTMLSRLSGMLRDIAMAYAFGTQSMVAAFLMAFRFAHLLRRLLGEGAMQSAFIPFFEKLRLSDPERAGRFFVDLTAALSLLLTVLIVLGMGGCVLCLSYGLISADNEQVLTYTLIMLPSLLFICLFGLNASLLQCHRHYFLSGIAPVFFNLIWIAGALGFSSLPIEEAMSWLSLFIIVACASQWAVTLPATVGILKSYRPLHGWNRVSIYSHDLKQLGGPLFMAIVGVSASQINNALDVIFARYADLEGPAYLWYAIRLQQLPLALFGIAISGALLPPLTRAIKNAQPLQFQHYLGFALRRSLALMLPMTAGIFLLGKASIELLYGYGDFQQESVNGTLLCLLGYGAGLIPMTLVLILAPAFYAQENFRLPTIASIACMGLNVILNAWFIIGMQWGPASVAWATSLSALVNMCILGYSLRAHMAAIIDRNFVSFVAKLSFATSIASFTSQSLSSFLPANLFLYIFLFTALFATCFFTAAHLLKTPDAYAWRSK